mmetsp:Transcript_80781/g.213075  ORF Transcript_80781/g.213075 Transcript_80781/m.213075 type:complete len:361 (-) Transcript_80781:949-2031(-)
MPNSLCDDGRRLDARNASIALEREAQRLPADVHFHVVLHRLDLLRRKQRALGEALLHGVQTFLEVNGSVLELVPVDLLAQHGVQLLDLCTHCREAAQLLLNHAPVHLLLQHGLQLLELRAQGPQVVGLALEVPAVGLLLDNTLQVAQPSPDGCKFRDAILTLLVLLHQRPLQQLHLAAHASELATLLLELPSVDLLAHGRRHLLQLLAQGGELAALLLEVLAVGLVEKRGPALDAGGACRNLLLRHAAPLVMKSVAPEGLLDVEALGLLAHGLSNLLQLLAQGRELAALLLELLAVGLLAHDFDDLLQLLAQGGELAALLLELLNVGLLAHGLGDLLHVLAQGGELAALLLELLGVGLLL